MDKKSNKLISLLSALSRTQRKVCRKIVQSPYFSGNEELIAYFDEIVRRIEKRKSLKKEEVWGAVHGNSKPYNDVRFRKYTSDLFKVVQESLVQESLKKDPGLKKFLYLDGLSDANPEKLIQGIERNWNLKYLKNFQSHQDEFLVQHLLEVKKESLLNYERRPGERTNIEESNKTLDIYFIVFKLKSALDAYTRKRTSTEEYQINLMPEVINFLELNPSFLDYAVIGVHYYLYRMNTEENSEEYFFKFKNIINQRPHLFSSQNGYSLLQPALNYCSRKINQGDDKFLEEYLFIYRFALPKRLLFEDDTLDPQQFRNTVTFALRSGEFNWAESFIKKYKDFIPEKQRSNAEYYNLATLFFYKRDYDQALFYLRDVEYENFTYNLNAKSMLLAIYYETDDDGPLDSLFDAISTYVNRHKEIPAYIQQAFRNLVSYTRRLTRMIPGDKSALEKLKKDLAEQQYVASRPWLEEKIQEFSN